MRIVLIGASTLAVSTANQLLKKGHEVVIIERDESVVEQLGDELDCGFLAGDGSRPAILEEASPENTDFLFCLSDNDQDNIIAAQIGRRMGFDRVVAKIKDAEFEPICAELEIDDIIVPDREIGRSLAALVEGEKAVDLEAAIKDGARFFTVNISEELAGSVEALSLPDKVNPVVYTRGSDSKVINSDTRLEEGDVLLLIAEDSQLDALRQQFGKD